MIPLFCIFWTIMNKRISHIQCLGKVLSRLCSLLGWWVVIISHQACPAADLIAPLTVRHLAIATNGKLAVDI